jgi:hypothetical protein
MDESIIRESLSKLDELYKKVILSLAKEKNLDIELDFNFDENIEEVFAEYKLERAELMLELSSTYELPKILDPVLRKDLKEFIQNGSAGFTNTSSTNDQKIRAVLKALDEDLKPEFSHEREQDLELDLFYSWFSPLDYVYGQLELAPIVLKHLDVPSKLNRLIIEIRECIIFQKYYAAGIMLRTITEIAIDDILSRNFPEVVQDFKTLGERLEFLSRKSQFAIPAEALNYYRKDLNEFVHGEKLIDRKKVKQYMDIVLTQIDELYEKSV